MSRLTATDAPGGLGANVVSRGELAIARRAGVPDDRITLEGVGKTDVDLAAAVQATADEHPLRWVAVESADEAAALAGMARAVGVGVRRQPRLDVLLRLNPDVTPETHAGLAVGAGTSKFGLAEDELGAAVEAGGGPDGPLAWRGIHLHVGSQLGAIDAWRDAVRRALALLVLQRGGLPDFDTLDVGGGFPVAPLGTAGPAGAAAVPSPALFAAAFGEALETVAVDRRPARVAIEPGRFLVARAGTLVARVLHVRDRGGSRMVVLDAGMTELIRPALYGAIHPIVALTSRRRPLDVGEASGIDEEFDDAFDEVRVEGPICESTDALGVHRLPPLERGDLVAILDAGAYGTALGSTYNGRPRPPQVLVERDGRVTIGRRRGSVATLG